MTCGMAGGARFAGLSISETADLMRFFHTKQSLEFTQNDQKKTEELILLLVCIEELKHSLERCW